MSPLICESQFKNPRPIFILFSLKHLSIHLVKKRMQGCSLVIGVGYQTSPLKMLKFYTAPLLSLVYSSSEKTSEAFVDLQKSSSCPRRVCECVFYLFSYLFFKENGDTFEMFPLWGNILFFNLNPTLQFKRRRVAASQT